MANTITVTTVLTDHPSGGYEPGTAARILAAGLGDVVEFVTLVPVGVFRDVFTVAAGRWESPPGGLGGGALVEWCRSTPRDEVLLSGDGRAFDGGVWHVGDPGGCGGWVPFERWTAAGRVGHGFVHPVSRRLVRSV